MIYQRHLASAPQGQSARAFSANPYKSVGGLQNVILDTGLHIIDEGNSTYGIYPDPNYLSVSPNEVVCVFSLLWIRAHDEITTLKLFDDTAANYVYATITQTAGLVPTLQFGVNGAASLTVNLSPMPHLNTCAVALGAVNGVAYINDPTTLSGFSYTAALPEGWASGRHTAQIKMTGEPTVEGVGMRTAAYDWGSPGWAASGVKPLYTAGFLASLKASDGRISPRVFETRYADFGGVAEGAKHDLFLDAAPFGYYGSSPALHLSAIGASQTSATFAPPGLNASVTAGSPSITISASGNVNNLLSGTTSYTSFTPASEPINPRAKFRTFRDDGSAASAIAQFLEAYYDDAPESFFDPGNYNQFQATVSQLAEIPHERMRAYLKVSPEFGVATQRNFLFSQGFTAECESAGASRLQEVAQNLNAAYHSINYTDNTKCFLDVFWELGEVNFTSTVATYRKILEEPVLEEIFSSFPPFRSLGFEWVIYTEGFEVLGTNSTFATQQRPAVRFSTGTQTVASAKAGNPFTSAYGTFTLT
jgi:hypothetical protein